MNGWNTRFLLGQRAYFQVLLLLVLGRVTIYPPHVYISHTTSIKKKGPPDVLDASVSQHQSECPWHLKKNTIFWKVWNYPSSQKMVIPTPKKKNGKWVHLHFGNSGPIFCKSYVFESMGRVESGETSSQVSPICLLKEVWGSDLCIRHCYPRLAYINIYIYICICKYIYIHTYQLAINHLYFSMWSVDW